MADGDGRPGPGRARWTGCSQRCATARPDLRLGRRGERMRGDQPLGLGDATDGARGAGRPRRAGSRCSARTTPAPRLDDVDHGAGRARARPAAPSTTCEALRRIERELERQGYLERGRAASCELTPRALRRLGVDRAAPGVRRARRARARRPRRPRRGCGRRADRGQPRAGGSATSSRSTSSAPSATPCCAPARAPGARHAACGSRSTTSRSSRPSGAPAPRSALLVDLSYSMALRGTWGAAKSTALALHRWSPRSYPQDAIEIIGFSDYARELQPDRARRPGVGHGPGHQPAARADAGRAGTSTSTATPSRSSWSSPTASRPRTCCRDGRRGVRLAAAAGDARR